METKYILWLIVFVLLGLWTIATTFAERDPDRYKGDDMSKPLD